LAPVKKAPPRKTDNSPTVLRNNIPEGYKVVVAPGLTHPGTVIDTYGISAIDTEDHSRYVI